MNKTRYTIYWMNTVTNTPMVTHTENLSECMIVMETLRNSVDSKHIAMCAELQDQVGRPGVDEVKDGKTPDGVSYTWVKRRDGGQ